MAARRPRLTWRSPPSPRADGQGGFTFIEVLVALVLMGMLISGMVTGMLYTASAANRNRDQATVESALTGIAERMKSLSNQPGFYVDCSTAAALQARYLASPARFPLTASTPVGQLDKVVVDVTEVKFWDGSAYQALPACTGTDDHGMQLVSLEVRAIDSANSRAARGVAVLRRPGLATP